ncbi:MAG TPA: hypothetical protein VM370_04290 [Candidatus Thermoplasmatota archaeon]|nr:hypothetical protein [Candidatus Thermoplasmatota archaeon]
MDEQTADALLTELIGWGLVEERSDEIGPTRRWSARVQATSERINLDVARTGTYPQGNPLVLLIATALREERPGLEGARFDDAVRMLVTLEVARMKPELRARYGF